MRLSYKHDNCDGFEHPAYHKTHKEGDSEQFGVLRVRQQVGYHDHKMQEQHADSCAKEYLYEGLW